MRRITFGGSKVRNGGAARSRRSEEELVTSSHPCL
jgi:hypothetical protein